MTKRHLFFLILAAGFFLFGQFWHGRSAVTGKPPALAERTLAGEPVAERIATGPGIIYFWAGWCGLCTAMQDSISRILKDYPGVTVALKSGDDNAVKHYLNEHGLAWPVLNDADGTIAQRYGIHGVPAVFVLSPAGDIAFSSIGYSTEPGLRIRLWLAAHW